MHYISKSYKSLEKIGVYCQKWLVILYIFIWGVTCTSFIPIVIIDTLRKLNGGTYEYDNIHMFSIIIYYSFAMGLRCMMCYSLVRLGNFVEDEIMYQIAKSLTHLYSNECEA